MNSPHDDWDEPMAEDEARSRPQPTGVARVDAVIETVSHLEDRPLDEHVSVFTSAHDDLRRTLDELPTEPA